MKRPPDTQIGDEVLMLDLDLIETYTADKGHDWDTLRRNLPLDHIKPVIKHCEFSSLDAAHDARLDDETYHRRYVGGLVIRLLNHDPAI